MKILALIIVFLISTAGIFSQSKLVIVGGDSVNFGDVKQINSPLERKIIFKNTGTDSLIIYKVKPGCGCTTSKMKKMRLGPGDEEALEISLNIDSFVGSIHKTIAVRCSDPDQPDRMINLYARVLNPFEYPRGQVITLDNLSVGNPGTGSMIIKNTTDENIVIKELKTEPEDLLVTIKTNTEIKAHTELNLSVTATPKKVGLFNGKIKFKTTNPDLPRVEIPIRGMVSAEPK